MKKFYIVLLIDGRYIHEATNAYTLYCDNIEEAVRFSSKKEAIEYGPLSTPFEVIKFYDK